MMSHTRNIRIASNGAMIQHGRIVRRMVRPTAHTTMNVALTKTSLSQFIQPNATNTFKQHRRQLFGFSSKLPKRPSKDVGELPKVGEGFPTLKQLEQLDTETIRRYVHALPILRHTSKGDNIVTHDSSSFTCHNVLKPRSFFPMIDTVRSLFFSIDLSRYVRVNVTSPDFQNSDFFVGSREAYVLMTDLFNTFHLDSSRKQLRALVQPRVYEALDKTWKMLDADNLRLIWKVSILNQTVRNWHIHDTDDMIDEEDLDEMMESAKSTQSNPNKSPFSPTGAAAADSSASSSSSGSKPSSDSTPKDDKESSHPLPPVRYVDMDMQYQVMESFEIWTTRFDQAKPQGSVVVADVVVPTPAPTPAPSPTTTPHVAVPIVPSASSSHSEPEPASNPNSTSVSSTEPAVRPQVVEYEDVVQEWKRIVSNDDNTKEPKFEAQKPKEEESHDTDHKENESETEKEAASEKKAESGTASPSNATSTPSASASGTPSTPSDPATKPTSTSTATPTPPTPLQAPGSDQPHPLPPMANFPAPLRPFFVLSDPYEVNRGLRFWSSLPFSAVPPQTSGYYSVLNDSSPQPKPSQAPYADWYVKDILD